jgi:hypothetical protein
MGFVLILMIKNEEKILQRCLESVKNLVDYFCITDTGSTDKSIPIAEDFLKTHKGKIFNDEWKNFGHNRNLSFINARDYLKEVNCNLESMYGLLIDADMLFVPGSLKEQTLTLTGYKIVQENGSLEYYNTRLVRMDYDWKCIGVTHEYWKGETENISKHICYIVDRNDGGSKSDKFQRDERLLLQGIRDEPTNTRYVFYLAQTYNCLGKWKDAIAAYKCRIKMEGWSDEVWYSMYMIGMCYKSLNDIHNFEYWMQKANSERTWRAEPLYELTKYFRETSNYFKAYHYCMMGFSIKFPENDILFVETFPHNGGFLYEKSILDYYVCENRTIGLRDSMNYLILNSKHSQSVINNLKFYIKPISFTTKPKEAQQNKTPCYIENWSPLIINESYIPSPPLFEVLNGSTYAIEWNSDLLAITHIGENYYCFIRFNKNYTPLAVSLPFLLNKNAYNSIYKSDNYIVCLSDSDELTIEYSQLEWIMFEKSCTD